MKPAEDGHQIQAQQKAEVIRVISNHISNFESQQANLLELGNKLQKVKDEWSSLFDQWFETVAVDPEVLAHLGNAPVEAFRAFHEFYQAQAKEARLFK